MGSFLHPLTLLGPGGEVTLQALVATGASYTWIPGPVLEGLGARPTLRRRFVLADGRETEYDMAKDLIKTKWKLERFRRK